MPKKRIFFLINSMEGGGAERVISNIVPTLKDTYDIDIITLKEGMFYDIPEDVNIIKLSNITHNIGLVIYFPVLLYRFWKILRKNHYSNGVSFLELANFINILVNPDAVISFRTTIEVFKGNLGGIYKKLIALLYPRAKKIIVNSEENRHDLASYLHIPLERIITLYNPVDLAQIEKLKLEPIDTELKDQIQGKKVFTTIGRLIKDDAIGSKNHSLVIQTIQELIQKGETNIIYLIIGDGPAKESLMKQVQENNLTQYVLFLGKQKNVFKFLYHSDYIIYASKNEGFPNALIEAIAVGIPIITSNFKTGANEVIMGEYLPHANKKLPIFGPNGVILELENFQEQFFEIYKKLDTIQQNQKGLDRFTHAEDSLEKILGNL